MTLGNEIRPIIPSLRRYAHALTGAKKSGDELIESTLKTIISDRKLLDCDPSLRIALFRVFHRVFREAGEELQNRDGKEISGNNAVIDKIFTYQPLTRQLVLLSLLEEMSVSDIAQIVDVREHIAAKMLEQAIEDLARNEQNLKEKTPAGTAKSSASRPSLS